jgi:hypothetical protein
MVTLRKVRQFAGEPVVTALFTGLFAAPLLLHAAARLLA